MRRATAVERLDTAFPYPTREIRNRNANLPYDKMLYRQRHRIENAFGRLKD